MTRNHKITTLAISLTILGCAFSVVPTASALGIHHGSATGRRNAASQGAYVTSAPQYLHRATNQEDCQYAENCDCPYAGEAHAAYHHYGTGNQNNQGQNQGQQSQGYGHGTHSHQGQGRHYANHEDCPYATE